MPHLGEVAVALGPSQPLNRDFGTRKPSPVPSSSTSSLCLSSANSAIGADDPEEAAGHGGWEAPTSSPKVTFSDENRCHLVELWVAEVLDVEAPSASASPSAAAAVPRCPCRRVRNPFLRRPPRLLPMTTRRLFLLARPRRSPYLPADVPGLVFACGQLTDKPNLYEGYRVISEQEMGRLRSGIYLSTPAGKLPILYDPLNKLKKPSERRRCRSL